MTRNIAFLILAAGASSRFGSAKQLLMYRGKPLLQHRIDKANRLMPGQVYVVLGANRELIEPVISGAAVMVNDNWADGLGSSIALGVRSLDPDYDAVCVLLADQIAVTSEHLMQLLDAFYHNRVGGDKIVAAVYAGKRGVPTLFPATLFEQLGELSGDSGAKQLLNQPDREIIEIELPAAALDIDTRQDWARYNR